MPQNNRKRRLIIMDLDGVCADFALAFSTVAERYFRVTPFTTSEQKKFRGIASFLSRDEIAQVWERVGRMPDFWKTVPCLLNEYDKRAMWMLVEEGCEFVYLTNRHDVNGMVVQTTDWLYACDIPRGAVIPVTDKAGWVAEAMVTPGMEVLGVLEDAPHNLTQYAIRGVPVTVREWSFNLGIEPDLPRVKSVMEFCDAILNKIEESK